MNEPMYSFIEGACIVGWLIGCYLMSKQRKEYGELEKRQASSDGSGSHDPNNQQNTKHKQENIKNHPYICGKHFAAG
jgi:hypothetical protein